MSKFIYTLKDEKGRDYQGTIEAKNRKEAEAKLDTKGYYLTSIKRESRFKLSLFPKKVSRMEVIVFSHQLATMIEAGIPIIRSLMALAAQTDNITFRTVINEIRTDIEGGSRTSDAMAKHPEVFSEFFIGLIRAGETGGIFTEMLRRISIYLEKEDELIRKIKGAFAYPAVVSVVAIGVVSYLLIFVVPVFQEVYNSIRVALPVPTRVLIGISEIIRSGWTFFLIVLIAMIFGFRIFSQTEKGSFLIDKFKLSTPLFGSLNKHVSVSRFTRSLGALISSGIPITKALNVSEGITANKVIAKAIDTKIRVAVNRGDNLADSFKAARFFPPVIIQMVAAGEESGALDNMLIKSADFVDEEIDRAIKSVTIKLEPILTIMLAVVVGFIALAIYLPMFDIIKQVQGR